MEGMGVTFLTSITISCIMLNILTEIIQKINDIFHNIKLYLGLNKEPSIKQIEAGILFLKRHKVKCLKLCLVMCHSFLVLD